LAGPSCDEEDLASLIGQMVVDMVVAYRVNVLRQVKRLFPRGRREKLGKLGAKVGDPEPRYVAGKWIDVHIYIFVNFHAREQSGLKSGAYPGAKLH
jgi:hypothetical protein